MPSVSDSEIHDIVQRVLQRTMGLTDALTSAPTPSVPPAQPVQNAVPVTSPAAPVVVSPVAGKQTIVVGADHGGYNLKESLKNYLLELGYNVVDCGTTDSKTAVDYPDFALTVAQLVGSGKAWRGILVDGAGIGSCMAANKVPGVRAAMCYDNATATNSREHNDANVLTLGAGMISDEVARQVAKSWLQTEFGGGRHARRVDKIKSIEKQFLKGGN